MPDIIMVLDYLHNQFGSFNRNIQTACFAKFIGFKNSLTRSRADVAAQKVRTVSGTKVFFEIANQSF